jgi:hypothetical protein
MNIERYAEERAEIQGRLGVVRDPAWQTAPNPLPDSFLFIFIIISLLFIDNLYILYKHNKKMKQAKTNNSNG